jgi:hypothetical protein
LNLLQSQGFCTMQCRFIMYSWNYNHLECGSKLWMFILCMRIPSLLNSRYISYIPAAWILPKRLYNTQL